ncbi:MAG: acyl-CoA reductase, partial [Gemmatimonadales bacterium]
MADGSELNAYWLPEIDGLELEIRERRFGPGKVRLCVPQLTPAALKEVLACLRRNRSAHLAGRPLGELLDAIDAAARRLTRPGEAIREELLRVLPDLTGYSPQMIALGLERMAAGWSATALRGAMQGEFGDLSVLERFRPRESGGRQRAVAAPLTVHIFSGNIPGVSVSSLVRALCVKSASLGKTAEGEPYLAVAFARALAEEAPELARCLAVVYWPGGSADLETAAFAEAGCIIAYGSDETVSRIRGRVP